MNFRLILIWRVGWGLKTLKINFRVNLYFNKFDPKKCKKFYTIRDNLGIKANLEIEANFEMKKLGNLSFLRLGTQNFLVPKWSIIFVQKGGLFQKFL